MVSTNISRITQIKNTEAEVRLIQSIAFRFGLNRENWINSTNLSEFKEFTKLNHVQILLSISFNSTQFIYR